MRTTTQSGVTVRWIAAALSLTLALFSGCKKDEPEEAAADEPRAAPEKVAEPELAEKEAALEKGEKAPRSGKRKLVAANRAKKEGTGKAGKAGKPGKADEEGKPGRRRAGARAAHEKAKPGARSGRKPVLRPEGKPPTRPVAGLRPPTRGRKGAGGDAEPDDDLEHEALDDEALEPDDEEPPGPRLRPDARRPGDGSRRIRGGGPRAEADPEPPAGGPRVRRSAGARRDAAAADPPRGAREPGGTPGGAGLPSRVRPNAELMLRKDDLKELLDVTAVVDVHNLSGIQGTDEYDGIYWGSPDGATYVAGVQIWRPRSPIEAQRRYTRMVRSYPNAEETTAITNKTFIAHWNDFIYLAFFDSGKQTVVSVTCHRSVCNEPRKLVLLALRVKERL